MSIEFREGVILVADELEAASLGINSQNVIYKSGALAVTPDTGLTLDYAALPAYQANVRGSINATAIAAGDVTLSAAHATLPRIDIVQIVTGTPFVVSVVTGTPAADPEPPAISATGMAMAHVYVAANTTSISGADITDKTQYATPRPAKVIRKSTNDTITADNTFTSDSELTWNQPASESWTYETHLYLTTTAGGGFKVAVVVPAGAALMSIAIAVPNGSATTVYSGGTGTSGGSIVGATAEIKQVHIWTTVETDTTAGVVAVQWAQNAASGDTTLHEGSFATARKVE